MQVEDIALNLGAGLEYRRFTVGFADLTAAATTQDVALFTLPAGGKILGVFQKHSVPFSGGSLTTMTCAVAKASSATFFTSTFDVFQAVADTTVQETSLFKSGQLTALAVVAHFIGSHNVNTATAGSVDIFVLYLNVTTPAFST
jgi:hypothetical protein